MLYKHLETPILGGLFYWTLEKTCKSFDLSFQLNLAIYESLTSIILLWGDLDNWKWDMVP